MKSLGSRDFPQARSGPQFTPAQRGNEVSRSPSSHAQEPIRINLFTKDHPRSKSSHKLQPRLDLEIQPRSPPQETARFGNRQSKAQISRFRDDAQQSPRERTSSSPMKYSATKPSLVEKELVAFRNQIRRLNPEEKVLYIQNAIRGAMQEVSKDLVTLKNKNDANEVVYKKIYDCEKENQLLKDANFKLSNKLTKIQKKVSQYKSHLQAEGQNLDNKTKIRDSLKDMLMSYRAQASLLKRSAKRIPFSTSKYDPDRENQQYVTTADAMKIPVKVAQQIDETKAKDLVVQPFDLIKVMKDVKTLREEEVEKVKSTVNKRNRNENNPVQTAEAIEAAVSKRFAVMIEQKGLAQSQKLLKDVLVEGKAEPLPEPAKVAAPDPKAPTAKAK